MATAAPERPVASPDKSGSPSPPYDYLAAVLSYLVPGLGQIYQGRTGKGLLFLVSLWGMFFCGMYLGSWSNVYLPEASTKSAGYIRSDSLHPRLRWIAAIANDRLAFAGQFWIGMAAWPAILQANDKWFISEEVSPFWHNFQRTPPERAEEIGSSYFKGWPTVPVQVLGKDFGKSVNDLQTEGDKSWDLGWVYTVVAGVLNILVIYDALAGPAFVVRKETQVPAAAPSQESPPS